MRAENPVKMLRSREGDHAASTDGCSGDREKEVSPRYVLEVKPVGPASGWDVGVREGEESGCLRLSGCWGAVGAQDSHPELPS